MLTVYEDARVYEYDTAHMLLGTQVLKARDKQRREQLVAIERSFDDERVSIFESISGLDP